ncbi:MAG TPA: hypothetical protein VI408_03375 [Gaiellaceae bacterium]
MSGLSLPARRALALDRVLAWRLALGALFLVGAVARTAAAWLRATPNYFPDEYIYTSLSRSLAAGHLPAVRGHVAHFPALLQPLVAAPAWWFGSLDTGYRVTQAIDSVAMSTAALAVWWTARRLGASRGPAFAAAALAIAVPDVSYSGWLLSEPFAYPLFVAALGAGSVALARPTRGAQTLFLAFALLATFARVQLAVVLVAFLAAAVVLRRVREQRVVAAGIGAAVVVGLAGGLGYYEKAPAAFHTSGLATLGHNLFVLAFAAGWIVVPGAVLGLAGAWRRPGSAEERAFGVFGVLAAAGVVAEATLYGDGGVVHERYGCYALPVAAIAFALYVTRGRPWRRAHAALAAGMLLLSSVVPMSSWAAAGGNAHSLVLTALLKVEALLGSPGAGSLAVALAVAALSLASLALDWRAVAALGVALCVAASMLATWFDVQNSRNVRAAFLPKGAEWVTGEATVVSAGNRTSALEQLFWNRGANRLALLPGAPRPDVFATVPLSSVRGQVVLDEDGNALVPAHPVRWNGPWLLARTPELVGRLANRSADGWLSPAGSGRGPISFTVVAPESMTLTIDGRLRHLSAHAPAGVCAPAGRFTYRFSKFGYIGFRPVSAKTTFPRAGCAR